MEGTHVNHEVPMGVPIKDPHTKDSEVPFAVPTFTELWFDDPIEGQHAQRLALELQHRIEVKALPVRMYLEKSVVPFLLQGMQHLVLERPNNPIEYLAAFLLKNNPQKVERPEKQSVQTTTGDETKVNTSEKVLTLPTAKSIPVVVNPRGGELDRNLSHNANT